MYLIYMHTSKTSGKSYIGKTANIANPNKRWKNGLGYTEKTQPLFAAAIKKYGWDDFEHTILETYIKTAEEACLREQYWIAYYHTWVYDPECNGYNITQGGDGNFGHKVSEQTKQKLREKRLAQVNLSLAHNKGKKYYNNGIVCRMFFPQEVPDGFIAGRLLSNEARQKISEHQSLANKQRRGKLKKLMVIKDGILKCIGMANLDYYLNKGYSIYQKNK